MSAEERRSDEPATGRTTRRRVVRGAAAAGALVAATYVTPDMRSIGVPSTQAALSGAPVADPYQGPPGRDPAGPPGKPAKPGKPTK